MQIFRMPSGDATAPVEFTRDRVMAATSDSSTCAMRLQLQILLLPRNLIFTPSIPRSPTAAAGHPPSPGCRIS